jgi:hypothetical protein
MKKRLAVYLLGAAIGGAIGYGVGTGLYELVKYMPCSFELVRDYYNPQTFEYASAGLRGLFQKVFGLTGVGMGLARSADKGDRE